VKDELSLSEAAFGALLVSRGEVEVAESREPEGR